MKKFFILKTVFIIFVILLVGCNSKPKRVSKNKQEKIPSYQGNLDIITTSKWVNENINEIIVLDTREKSDYDKGHIPNAINVQWQDFSQVNGKEKGDKNWGNLLSPKDITKVIQDFGIDDKKTIVVYGNPPKQYEDGRVVWTLLSANLKNVKILNGGWNSWISAKYDISKKTPNIKKSNYQVKSLDTSLSISTDKLYRNLKKYKIVDARESNEYNGATKLGQARGGHIPNAINITWSSLLNEDGTIKSQKEIDSIMKKNKISKNDTFVVYCAGGIRSGHMTSILRMSGYSPINYDSSMYEWSSNKNLPLEK